MLERPKESDDLTTASLEVRDFGMFAYEDGMAETVKIARIGKLEDLIARAYPEGESPFPRAGRLIEAFSEASLSNKIGNSELRKRPHFLVCGGFVRDALMDMPPKDIDFATNATYEEVEGIFNQAFQEEIAAGIVTFDTSGKQYNVMRIVFRADDRYPREEYEIASFRRDSDHGDGRRPDGITQEKRPGIDVLRRDLTVNALFMNPKTGTVIDYVGGLKDIADRKLRFVGDPARRIGEDRIRAFRYIRFLFKTGFTEDPFAKEAIRQLAPDIVETLSGDEVRKELNKAFLTGSPGDVVDALETYGLLQHLMPEVSALKECPQGPPYHMEGDAYIHTGMVLNNLPENASVHLIWAALLHDIAKPETRSTEPDEKFGERVHFYGHEQAGVPIAERMLDRLRFSNKDRAAVTWMIEHHLSIFSFPNMRESKARTLAASPYFLDLVALARADALSSIPALGVPDEGFGSNTGALIDRIMERYQNIKTFTEDNAVVLDEIRQAVNGNAIAEAFQKIHNQKLQGKNIGILKASIMEEITMSGVTDVAKALEIMNKKVREGLLPGS